jgi:hypothetical protein
MYTLQGKTRLIRHVRFSRQSTYAQRTLHTDGPHRWQPFTSHRHGWTDTTAPDSTSQPGWVVRGTRPNFSPKTTIEAVGLSQAYVDDRLLGLPSPYHRHAIDTFNSCSRVPTPRSLTDTVGGYHIENLGIAITLSPSSLLRAPLIPLMAPSGLRLFTTITNWTGEGNKT